MSHENEIWHWIFFYDPVPNYQPWEGQGGGAENQILGVKKYKNQIGAGGFSNLKIYQPT